MNVEMRPRVGYPESYQAEREHFPLNVMVINMEGESDLSLHEPIGLESVASRVLHEMPGVRLNVYDVQPELVKTGKVNTDNLADRIRQFADQDNGPLLLGIGVPIYSWEYTKSLLIKLDQDPPKSPMTVVLGNAIPTYTNPDLLKREFPNVKLVVGEGEEVFANMAKALANGDEVEDSLTYKPPDLKKYVPPLRALTQEIINLGGSVKVEASRGCDYGACTFCSRCLRSGKDYRTVPEDIVVSEVQSLLDEFDISRFELTDEEAFGDVEATSRLVSALKSADLPRVPFVASLRVDTLIKLKDEGLLDQLQEVGLEKVFLGVEAGSDEYQKQVAKGQTMEEVNNAMNIVQESGMDMEIGFIMFSWRMTYDMLRKNVEFLSDGKADYVSSLFNLLAVRAGTLDEKLLRRYVERGMIKDYNLDEKFSINLSYYQDVPFLDQRVGEAYKEAEEFSSTDARVHYALKSLVRASSLPADMQKRVQELYIGMKDLHLRFLRNLVGLEKDDDVKAKRRELVQEIQKLFQQIPEGGGADIVRRETDSFLAEDSERMAASGDQIGSLLVCRDPQGKILLVRPRDQEFWAFPGGNVHKGEDHDLSEELVEAAIRETKEELGVQDIDVLGELPVVTKDMHYDQTTGLRSHLILYHHLARLNSEIDIQNADHEIVDTLWLSRDDIINSKVKVRDNVMEIVKSL